MLAIATPLSPATHRCRAACPFGRGPLSPRTGRRSFSSVAPVVASLPTGGERRRETEKGHGGSYYLHGALTDAAKAPAKLHAARTWSHVLFVHTTTQAVRTRLHFLQRVLELGVVLVTFGHVQ